MKKAIQRIEYIQDIDLTEFVSRLHTVGGYAREKEFNMFAFGTATGDTVAVAGRHMHLGSFLEAYCTAGDIYKILLTAEGAGGSVFCFHVEREEGGHCFGGALAMDADMLRRDAEKSAVYPESVRVQDKEGKYAEFNMEEWNTMDSQEKREKGLKIQGFLYNPAQVAELRSHYAEMFGYWKGKACVVLEDALVERLKAEPGKKRKRETKRRNLR